MLYEDLLDLNQTKDYAKRGLTIFEQIKDNFYQSKCNANLATSEIKFKS